MNTGSLIVRSNRIQEHHGFITSTLKVGVTLKAPPPRYISSTTEPGAGDYDGLAAQLNSSAGAIGVAVYRLRRHYGEFVRAEIAQTVAHPGDIDEELHYVCSILAG